MNQQHTDHFSPSSELPCNVHEKTVLSESLSPASIPTGSTDSTFASLGLDPLLLRALEEVEHRIPTPVQSIAIPPALQGNDILANAQTGTGKTAAFALPLLHRLLHNDAPASSSTSHVEQADQNELPRSRFSSPHRVVQIPKRPIRTLILSPTRELAAQIAESLSLYGRYTKFRFAIVVGGVRQSFQTRDLRAGVDILVATPGRLCDLVEQRIVDLSHVEILVLDEADQMLEVGFLPAIRHIVGLIPQTRQTMFFSATMPAEIQILAKQILHNPVRVSVASVASIPERLEQTLYFVDQRNKSALLCTLLEEGTMERAIIFTRTKHGASHLTDHLLQAGISAEEIHGNKAQHARTRALTRFRNGAFRVLVATDVVGRGIDIPGISHIVNFDIPPNPEAYIHRIGRTARAGSDGVAISFCSGEERRYIMNIERSIKQKLKVLSHPSYPVQAPPSRSFEDRSSGGRSYGQRSPRSFGSSRPYNRDGFSGNRPSGNR